MLTGGINADDDAKVAVTLWSANARTSVSAVVDTGFNGYLSVPLSLVARVYLTFRFS